MVALSATVSNAEEFGDWLTQVRGGTTVIVDEHRPVPLWQHVLAGGRLYDLFADAARQRDAGRASDAGERRAGQPGAAAAAPGGTGAAGDGRGGRAAARRPAAAGSARRAGPR